MYDLTDWRYWLVLALTGLAIHLFVRWRYR